MTKHARSAALLVVLALSAPLVACGQGDIIAEAQSDAAQSGPVIDSERVTAALEQVQAVLDEGEADEDLLATRLEDPALRLRQAQYALAEATSSQAPALNVTAESLALTNTTTWPRTVLNFTTTGDSSLPMAFVLVQDDARSPYKLQSWVRILGGTTLTLPAVMTGSATLVGDSTGFVKTPEEALAAYVEMLNSGKAGNDDFTSDDFSVTYLQDAKTLNDASASAGSVTAKAKVADFPVTGVVLEDGSALVSASFTYTLTYDRTVARSTMRLGGSTAALSKGDDDTVVGKATVTYVASVLLLVPSAETGGQITVVGAERAIESVVKDDSSNPDNAG